MGGHVETVNLLLERGASPTARAAGQTPAEAAARAGQVLTAERLRRAAAGAAPS
jgi:ankyrin repeat protein